MDLNVKIIEAVKKCPMLYKTNASLAERQGGWQQIAKQMQLQEQFLKTRWHFLRERYQRECQYDEQQQRQQTHKIGQKFIYKKEMEFLLPHIRTNNAASAEAALEEVLPDNVIKPEFIITEKDLQDEGEVEEYVFLEVEALENASGEDEPQQETEPCELETEHREEAPNAHCNLSKNNEEKPVVKSALQTENKENESGSKNVSEPKLVSAEDKQLQHELKQALEEETVVAPSAAVTNEVEIKTDATNVQMPQEPRKEPATKNNIVPKKQAAEVEVTNDDERSEDVIFGELVTAMLRHMPTEKKRAIKKDIMNLLLA